VTTTRNFEALGLSSEALEKLYARVAKTVGDPPRCAAQVAIARHGRLAGVRTFGRARFAGAERDAGDDSLFAIFSVTKAITSSAVWLLLQDEKLALGERVAEHIPEFGSHGKEVVTVEQLLTHTAGFPRAPFAAADWRDPARRLERFAAWRLDWQPGSRFVYHSGSTMWVLAELITRASGVDYREFLRARVFEPLELRDLFVGLPDREHQRVAEVVAVGERMTTEARAVSPVDAPVIDADDLRSINEPENRRLSGPGGGGIATAAGMALFLDALLSDWRGDGAGIWQRNTLEDAWTPRQVDLIDPMTRQPARRGLGVVTAGAEGKMWRGFPENVSPRTFGHMGAGGQVAWADPETGLCFAYFTNGAQQDAARQGATGFRLSTLAASCVVD
jgi:CubicO group peptidase (beta-lactamase class C family)